MCKYSSRDSLGVAVRSLGIEVSSRSNSVGEFVNVTSWGIVKVTSWAQMTRNEEMNFVGDDRDKNSKVISVGRVEQPRVLELLNMKA